MQIISLKRFLDTSLSNKSIILNPLCVDLVICALQHDFENFVTQLKAKANNHELKWKKMKVILKLEEETPIIPTKLINYE